MEKLTLKGVGSLLKKTFVDLRNNDPLRLAAATAFFTTFALPAVIVIIVQAVGLIYNPNQLSDEIVDHLRGVLGMESAQQIQDVLKSFSDRASNWYITAAGFLFLVFVATTLFKIIKDSINQIWGIKHANRPGFGKKMKLRAKSVAVIVLAGFLFVGGLFSEGVIALLKNAIEGYWVSGAIITVIHQIVAVIIVTIWFAVLFKFLPDAKLPWPTAIAGALFTAILFTAGKFLVAALLSGSNIGDVYGASGSIVIIILFVFYSSFILYYGAAFTKQWGEFNNKKLKPREYAIFYELSEREIEK